MWYTFNYNFGSVQSLTRSDNGHLLDKWLFEDHTRVWQKKKKGSATKWIRENNKLNILVFNYLCSFMSKTHKISTYFKKII
jgi:hypothetical protein